MLLSGTLRRVPVWQHVNLIVCCTVWERSDLARFEHISLSRALVTFVAQKVEFQDREEPAGGRRVAAKFGHR